MVKEIFFGMMDLIIKGIIIIISKKVMEFILLVMERNFMVILLIIYLMEKVFLKLEIKELIFYLDMGKLFQILI